MIKIKQILLPLCCIFTALSNANAQQIPAHTMDSLMKESVKYYKGTKDQLIDYRKFFDISEQCAKAGNAIAMYNLAGCYLKGLGTKVDINKAIEWYNKSAEKKNAKAFYRLGVIYKKGLTGLCDYEKAYSNFSNAAELDNTQGIYYKGYMLYTGLGCLQNYEAAYPLFKKAAQKGYPHAMRFLGLCFRNGYGTEVNKDSAVYWMNMASKLGNGMSDDELAAPEPENADIAGSLIEKVKAAQAIIKQGNPINTYTRVYHNVPAKEIEGTYEGWLLKYDWSGKHVVKADKLKVELIYDNDSLLGKWTENDTASLPVRALLTKKALVFNGMAYNKYDHYYRTKPEQLKFEKAGLQLIKDKDSTYLCGNLQLFSVNRNEPAKPMYVALIQTAKGKNNQLINYVNDDGSALVIKNVNGYPNPFTEVLNIEFELKETCTVNTELLTADGTTVYKNASVKLEAGYYILPIKPGFIAPGNYIVSMQFGKYKKILKVVKL